MFVAHIQQVKVQVFRNYTKFITCQSLDPDNFLCILVVESCR